MITRERDNLRSEVYGVERLARAMFERTGEVRVAGTTVTLTQDARFGTLESVQAYVNSVLAHPTVRERWSLRAARPVTVRSRRGAAKAHYERGNSVIAVPTSDEGSWSMRELVALHELAHHLTESHAAAHGPEFIRNYVDLVGMVLGPEAGFVLGVLFAEAGLS